MQNIKNLNSIVRVSSKFQRSANIEEDGKLDSDNGFVLQQTSLSCLETMASFINNTQHRTFTWTGPYGSGKSSLALFLTALINNASWAREKLNKNCSEDVFTHLESAFEFKSPWRIISIVGHDGDLSADLLNKVSPRGTDKEKAIQKLIQTSKSINTIVIIDELGKFLDGGNSRNCYFLQQLAEAVNRAKTKIIVVGILHQSFDVYAAHLPKEQQDEWLKVQGRYVDIPLLSPPEEVLELLEKSIDKEGVSVPDQFKETVSSFLAGIHSQGNTNLFSRLIGCWPLNPTVSLLLGPISRRRFWQNSRSVFNFLASREPYGFTDFVNKTPLTDAYSTYNLDDLWDYLKANFEQSIISSSVEGHQWAMATECVDKVERCGTLPMVKVVKAIAIIGLFKRGTSIDTTAQVIQTSLYPISREEIIDALKSLLDQKIIIKRQYNDTFVLFEGSDFDLASELKHVRAANIPLDIESLKKIISYPPIVARSHYSKSGALRWFACELCNINELDGYLKSSRPDKNATGRLILCLDSDDSNNRKEVLKSILKQHQEEIVFIAQPSNSIKIRSYAADLQAILHVSKNPKLEGDSIARKEVLSALRTTTEYLKKELTKALYGVNWISATGEEFVSDNSKLGHLISAACDDRFTLMPRLVNELVNRDQLSSNIKRAQRLLMYAMVEHPDQEKLGIKGTPPESMIYSSVLKKNIHRFDKKNNSWFFVEAESLTARDPYKKLWEETEKYFKESGTTQLSGLYKKWKKEPVGMKVGVMPILSLAFFLAHKRSISVYVNSVFCSEIDAGLVDTWLLSPETISFRYVAVNSYNKNYLSSLSSDVGNYLKVEIEADALSLSRELVKTVLQCPKWVLVTRQLQAETREFRDAVVKAWDPLKLIFDDLPRIFKTNSADALGRFIISALQEIQGTASKTLDRIRQHLLNTLDSDGDLDKLEERAIKIKNIKTPLQMQAFISRVESLKRSNASDLAIEGFISLAVAKPKSAWTDLDIETAFSKIADWSLNFRHLEGMAAILNIPTNRRVVSLVTAGTPGRVETFVDVNTERLEEIQDVENKIKKLCDSYDANVAIAALIDVITNRVKAKE